MVRLPCRKHLWHDVSELHAAHIVAALTGAYADAVTDADGIFHGESPDDHLVCPLEARQWASDTEMYYEHTEQALFCAGLIRKDDEEGWVEVPADERDPYEVGRV